MDWVMLGLFGLLEEYDGPSILTVSALFFVIFLEGGGRLCIKIIFGTRLSCRT
jgi:hypothetical protein